MNKTLDKNFTHIDTAKVVGTHRGQTIVAWIAFDVIWFGASDLSGNTFASEDITDVRVWLNQNVGA